MSMVSEAKFVPGQTLGLEFPEQGGLAFLQSEATVVASQVDDVTHYSMSFDHPPLESEQLIEFLATVAPHKGFNSVEGTLADWDIVDSLNVPDRDRLVALHEKMGTPWIEFLKSCVSFSNVLRGDRLPRFGHVTVLPDEVRPSRAAERERAKTESLYEAATSYDDVVELLKTAGVADAEQKFYIAMQTVINRRRKKTNLSNLNRIKEESRTADMVHWLSRLLPPETLEVMIDQKEDQLYGRLTAADGSIYSFPRERYPYTNEEFTEQLKKAQTLRRGAFEADVTVLKRVPRYSRQLNPEPVDYAIVNPDSIRRVVDSFKITPLITWTKDAGGERELTFERSVEVREGYSYTDGVLGALAVAYLSPELRTTWPSTMRLGRSRAQQLGAAQVPVLALLPKYRHQLTNSAFIVAAEKAVTA